jgi:hypothetical protein
METRTLGRNAVSEKEDIVNKLINSDLQDFQNGKDIDWFKTILGSGWKGYRNMGVVELKREFAGRCLSE